MRSEELPEGVPDNGRDDVDVDVDVDVGVVRRSSIARVGERREFVSVAVAVVVLLVLLFATLAGWSFATSPSPLPSTFEFPATLTNVATLAGMLETILLLLVLVPLLS